ncbi:MAG: hypothetical protein IPI59_13510 [Sphingobacteriales bacterium]|nr:hypothetical protein [Sphingobacteriales bacterium]MBP9140189.1 hypothetical protein [Chitinophagales bacterium]MDA0197677.1 hypothetical protein [Bacteroidota bacterium]MBK7528534.1 hypothetical protein [Sphingobacteriales bacterium]MBK8679508.1 hypothetical protein [Sphingobacteriales bacterium]
MYLQFDANHRRPTFNDLYWQPGGNTQLQPEKSWGLALRGQNKRLNINSKLHLQVSAKTYYRQINNWIQWIPNPQGVWSPRNVKSVANYGGMAWLESSFEQGKGWVFSGFFSLSATKTFTTKSSIANDASLYKQQIYVPVFQTEARIRYQTPNWYIQIEVPYTSKRYISSDHSNHLPVFFTAFV